MRTVIDQATDRARRALRELDAASGVLEHEERRLWRSGSTPLGGRPRGQSASSKRTKPRRRSVAGVRARGERVLSRS